MGSKRKKFLFFSLYEGIEALPENFGGRAGCLEVAEALLRVGLVGAVDKYVADEFDEVNHRYSFRPVTSGIAGINEDQQRAAKDASGSREAPPEGPRVAGIRGDALDAIDGFCRPCGSFDRCHSTECLWRPTRQGAMT